jgi:hypothetical protein
VIGAIDDVKGRRGGHLVEKRGEEIQVRQFVTSTLQEQHGEFDIREVNSTLGRVASRRVKRESEKHQTLHTGKWLF